jgi:hypothetical protein
VDQVDTGHHLEPFPENMGRGPAAGRSHVDLARIGLGVSDELRDCLGWNGCIDHHDIRATANARDRRDVSDEIEIELAVKRRVHRVRQPDKQERIAVRRCPHDAFGGHIAAGTRSVLDDEWLPERAGDRRNPSAWSPRTACLKSRREITLDLIRRVATAQEIDAQPDLAKWYHEKPRWAGARDMAPTDVGRKRCRNSARQMAGAADKIAAGL